MSQAINISLELPSTSDIATHLATDNSAEQGRNPGFAREFERQVAAHGATSKTKSGNPNAAKEPSTVQQFQQKADKTGDDEASLKSDEVSEKGPISEPSAIAQDNRNKKSAAEIDSARINKQQKDSEYQGLKEDAKTNSLAVDSAPNPKSTIAPETLLTMLDSAQQFVVEPTASAEQHNTEESSLVKHDLVSANRVASPNPISISASQQTTERQATNNFPESQQARQTERDNTIASQVSELVKAPNKGPSINVVQAQLINSQPQVEDSDIATEQPHKSVPEGNSLTSVKHSIATGVEKAITLLQQDSKLTSASVATDGASVTGQRLTINQLEAKNQAVQLMQNPQLTDAFEAQIEAGEEALSAPALAGKKVVNTPSVRSGLVMAEGGVDANKDLIKAHQLNVNSAAGDQAIVEAENGVDETFTRASHTMQSPQHQLDKSARQINQATEQVVKLNQEIQQATDEQSIEHVVDELSEQLNINPKEQKQASPVSQNTATVTANSSTYQSPLSRVHSGTSYDSEVANAHSQAVDHQVSHQQQLKQVEKVALEVINVNHKNFAQQVKEKVLVMVSQKLQSVDIQLDPPELGNVHIRVNLQGEQAMVNFVVQQPQAKEALEQHMNRLRDMLSESGIDLGDTDVKQQFAQQGDEMADNQAFEDDLASDELVSAEATLENREGQLVNVQSIGIDYFA
ncbi:flagellar hook-length control protein FliK [Thalassotalea sp. LPB0316]|uniref:flagellar hook-length control protein FliK n=1 Tax=Thalassotalea sp. LPB0316 TaxID=2769490 RepID=UPI0018684EB3|nr:flagellar hook-length control protein FliK [Thalassotalea sp. LPB0316]QOL27094.1 flagellar hook-length control protein FliK [Thalassotalea sp. LPB0316]